MIAGLVSAVLLVPLFVGAEKGEWGVVAVCGVLIVLVIAGAVISAMDSRAWMNRTSYWAKSGKDRAKLRHKWEAEARAEEEAERAKRMAAWRAKHGSSATQEMPYVQATEPKPRVEEPFVCKYCQKEVRGHMMVMPAEGGVVRFYMCPVCHRQTYVTERRGSVK